MGSIDSFKFPDRDEDEIVEMADVLVNKHGGKATSKEQFAQDLGHSSAKSGTFHQKVADARKFGVLPSRGLEAQELAYDLANPKDEEHEREARFRMYQNIPILDRLHSHLSGDKPPAEFWRILTEITDANPKEAKDSADEIKELYQEMLRYEPEETDEDDSEILTEDETRSQESAQQHPQAVNDGIYVQVGDNSLNLDSVSIMNLRLARTMLEQMEERLKQQNSTNETDTNESDEDDAAHGDGLEAFTD